VAAERSNEFESREQCEPRDREEDGVGNGRWCDDAEGQRERYGLRADGRRALERVDRDQATLELGLLVGGSGGRCLEPRDPLEHRQWPAGTHDSGVEALPLHPGHAAFEARRGKRCNLVVDPLNGWQHRRQIIERIGQAALRLVHDRLDLGCEIPEFTLPYFGVRRPAHFQYPLCFTLVVLGTEIRAIEPIPTPRLALKAGAPVHLMFEEPRLNDTDAARDPGRCGL
jgi:hypothetical protein